jgi:hypothetical protein
MEENMKKKAVVFVFLVSLGLSILGAHSVVAAQYLGETTWTLTLTHDKNGPITPPVHITMRGCINRMGGAYYTVQTYIDPAPDGNPIGSGGGILVGNLLYLTLNHSQKHLGSDRETGVTQVEMDKATLNGTFYQVARSFNTATAGPNPVFTDHFWAGIITRTGPVINLTPGAFIGPSSLLLLEK